MERNLHNESQSIAEMHAIISGDVQGVGFRATTRYFAQQLNIKGTVKNLSDGTVEIFAQAEKITLEKLLEKLKTEYGLSIVSADAAFTQPSKLFSDFKVVH